MAHPGQEKPKVYSLPRIDFRVINTEEVFKGKKEILRLKPEKLETDCQFCKLIHDYSKVCEHNAQLKKQNVDELKDMVPAIQIQQDVKAKKEALQKVTKSLDLLSTYKITSLGLL